MNLITPIKVFRDKGEDFLHRNEKLAEAISLRIPYFPQFMSADFIERYIARELSPATDPRWRESGATTPEEYELWTWNDCGIACLYMILSKMGKSPAGIVALAQEAAAAGAFIVKGDQISPLQYEPFCTWVKAKFGVQATAVYALSLSRIKRELSQGNFVIVSVHPEIRRPETVPPSRGGHLVLMTGYDDKRGGCTLHNPSGFQSNNSQANAFVTYDQFKNFFAGRGVVIKK